MTKRISRITTILLIALCLSGCSGSLYEREYVMMREHSNFPSDGDSDGEIIAEVSSAAAIREACVNMIRDYVRYGIILFAENYDGDPAEDVPIICQETAENTSLGIYAVNSINYAVMRRDGVLEAEISIDFKKTSQEIRNIQYTGSRRDIEELISSRLEQAESGVTFVSQLRDIDEEYIQNYITELYYGDALLSAYEPNVTTEIYIGFDNEIIVEIDFGRRYSQTRTLEMLEQMIGEAELYLTEYSGSSTGQWLMHVCDKLGNSVRYINPSSLYTRTINDNTAYGALCEKKAVSEGFAMAFKAICDLNDVECFVVRGQKDGAEHFWNIVMLDSEYYHIDTTVVSGEGMYRAFLKNDTSLGSEYTWDRSAYPECTGFTTYYDLMQEEIY